MIVKVASVVGKKFDVALLHAVFPMKLTHPEILEHVKDLERKELFTNESSTMKFSTFSSVVTQEVAYDLLLYSQRSELHNNIAFWYEEQFANDLLPYP